MGTEIISSKFPHHWYEVIKDDLLTCIRKIKSSIFSFMNKEMEERLPVSVSAAVFIEDINGRLLLVQQAAESKGYRWGPPAGGMKAFEDPLMAAMREVQEEIGVQIEIIDLLGVYTVNRGTSASGVGFVFRGKIVSGEIKIKPDEIMNYRFFTPDEISKLIIEDILYKPEYNLQSIQDWLRGVSYPWNAIRRLQMDTQLQGITKV